MSEVQDIETRRMARQIQLDAELSAKERNILGQFATPPAMALDIIAHAKTLLDPETPI